MSCLPKTNISHHTFKLQNKPQNSMDVPSATTVVLTTGSTWSGAPSFQKHSRNNSHPSIFFHYVVYNCFLLCTHLSKSTGFSFPFQQAQDIAFADWSFHVADNRAARGASTFVIHKFDTNLCHVTRVSGASQNAIDLGKLDWLILVTQPTKISKAVSNWNR
jgi:hypothetical protein